MKLSFGVGLIETYLVGSSARIAPIVDRWIATAAADQPQLYGSGDLCDLSAHDTATSTMQQDLGWRSVGCQPQRLGLPWLWAQAFDDGLFPPDMAISMWRRAPQPRAAPPLPVDGRPRRARGGPVGRAGQARRADALPRRRDAGAVAAGAERRLLDARPDGPGPGDSYAYPAGAWYRQTADAWPPAGIAGTTYRPCRDGDATQGSRAAGRPISRRSRRTSATIRSQRPRSPRRRSARRRSSVPATNLPGFIASFRTAAFSSDRELSGAPSVNLSWTPAAPDSQLVLELFDQAPSGDADAVQPRRPGIARRDARASSGRCASTATRSASASRRATASSRG